MTGLRRAWLDAIATLGGRAALESADELVTRYAEPHRRYHTARHVDAVLADAAWLAAQVGLAPQERAVVALAACAHDVVYDARPGEDERASAAWATAALTAAGVATAEVERVRALVLATMSHDAEPDDLAAAVLLDADLAILAAAPAEYEEYVAGVRAEYADVDDDAWRAGRAGVLKSLVSRDDLFRTEVARRRWDEAARRNVAAELAGLHPLR